MTQPLQARVAAALAQVIHPRTGTDVVSAEMVRDIGTTTSGKVRLTMFLSPNDPASLVRDVRQAVEAVEGVSEVRVDVKDASAPASAQGRARAASG